MNKLDKKMFYSEKDLKILKKSIEFVRNLNCNKTKKVNNIKEQKVA